MLRNKTESLVSDYFMVHPSERCGNNVEGKFDGWKQPIVFVVFR